MFLIDNTARKAPTANISTHNITEEVEMQCLPDAIYSLIIGNVKGARAADHPETNWQEVCAVSTRDMLT